MRNGGFARRLFAMTGRNPRQRQRNVYTTSTEKAFRHSIRGLAHVESDMGISWPKSGDRSISNKAEKPEGQRGPLLYLTFGFPPALARYPRLHRASSLPDSKGSPGPKARAHARDPKRFFPDPPVAEREPQKERTIPPLSTLVKSEEKLLPVGHVGRRGRKKKGTSPRVCTRHTAVHTAVHGGWIPHRDSSR